MTSTPEDKAPGSPMSVPSTTVTPKGNTGQGSSSVESPNTPSSIPSKKRKRLTEDEKMFREKERSEKRQKLEEEKFKKEEEKRKRELDRLEKLKEKEQERIEKERQKELERLEKERQKEVERIKREEENAKKSEEKRKKEEERLKKEEERLKKEEERLKKEDEKEQERKKLEEKKAKQAEHFTKFFQKSPATTNKVRTLTVGLQQTPPCGGDIESDKENKDKEDNSNSNGESSTGSNSTLQSHNDRNDSSEIGGDIEVIFQKKLERTPFCPMPFEIKSNMAIAPLIRRNSLSLLERNAVDLCFSKSCEDSISEKSDFLERIKSKNVVKKSGRTEIEMDGDVRVIIQDVMDDNEHMRYRMKLIQFHDNRRPAYWGTWKRPAQGVTGRRPLTKEKELDYEFESDDEWEDEPEDAEEIENSDGEEEAPEDPAEGEPVDEENDDGWMVPHGYLSGSEQEGEEMDIETAKVNEKQFFRSLKEQVKLGIPVIQSVKLSDFRMMFPPRPKVRRSGRAPKLPSKDSQSLSKGFLAMELPSDEEDDVDWNENCKITSAEGEVISSDSSDESEEDSDDEASDDEASDDEPSDIPILG